MKRKPRSGLVSGIALFTIGLVFLLDNLGYIDIALIWPLIFIGIGLGMIVQQYFNNKYHYNKDKHDNKKQT